MMSGLATTGSGPVRGRPAVRMLGRNQPFVVSFGVLAVLVAIYAAVQPGALSFDELNVQVSTALALVLVAAGQTIVMLTGGLDLSVGATVSLSTCLAATLMSSAADSALWSVAIIGVGVGAGLINGLLVWYMGLSSFIVTLATWSVFGGVALLVLESPGGSVPDPFVSALTGSVGVVGVPLLLLLGGCLFWAWFRTTRTVSRLRAVGSDEEAARLAGVNVGRTKIYAFMISGGLAAAGGLLLTTQLGGGDPVVGNSFVLQSVAAAVIGGTALSGGRGDVFGAVSGALVVTLLGSVVFALGLPSYWQIVTSGAVLVIAALANSALATNGNEE